MRLLDLAQVEIRLGFGMIGLGTLLDDEMSNAENVARVACG